MRNRTWTWPVVMAAAGLAANSASIVAQTGRDPVSSNPAVPGANSSRDLPNSGPPEPPRAAEGSAESASESGKGISTVEAVMLRSRGARTLLRNGTDFIKYQQYEKALTYLREAERRQKELNANERSALRQAIESAQQGLRTPSLQTGYARTRRPQAGSIAIASRRPAETKSDPAVARTQAPAESLAEPAPFGSSVDRQPVPSGSRMESASAGTDRLAPLSPEILAKELPSAADLAQSDSARSALREYEAAGRVTNQPRQPLELPKPLNEKIDSLQESESQFQASESRPDPSPEAIAASLSAMRNEGTPAPLPGSPSGSQPDELPTAPLAQAAVEPSKMPLIDQRAEQTESVNRRDVPAEPAPAPVVETPALPPLEPAEAATPEASVESASASVPTLTAPELPAIEPDAPAEPAALPALPEFRAAPAVTPPSTLVPDEMPEALNKPEAARSSALSGHKDEPLPELPADTDGPAKVVLEVPAAETEPSPDRTAPAGQPQGEDRSTSPVAVPAAATDDAAATETVSSTKETRLEMTRPDSAVSPASTGDDDQGGLPPLPAGAGPISGGRIDSLPPLPVQPIAEASDDSSDLPPLPIAPETPKPARETRSFDPPTSKPESATEPARTEKEESPAELPPLPAAALTEAMPPLPAPSQEPAQAEAMPPLPVPAETAEGAGSASAGEAMPPLPDSPPAPTAAGSDELPQLPEPPVRTAQAEPTAGTPPGSGDALPPLPAEEIAGSPAKEPVGRSGGEVSTYSRRFLSGLSDRQRREIEELARLQLERSGGTTPGLSPLDAPARPAGDTPRVPLPAGNSAMFGATEDPLVRLELPRAPSPAEARPIRAILLPEQFDTIKQREFEPRRKMWASAATAHYPLYFQDPTLERYGISVEQRMGRAGRKLTYPIDDPKESKLRNQIATPFFSSGLFALQIATWPFRAIADPPWESTYDLGYYRPGDIVPEDTVVIPWKGVGPLFRGNGY